MDWNIIEGCWKELKGKAREQWGRITDDEFEQTKGKRDALEGVVQRVYGKTKDEVKREVDTWTASCNRP